MPPPAAPFEGFSRRAAVGDIKTRANLRLSDFVLSVVFWHHVPSEQSARIL